MPRKCCVPCCRSNYNNQKEYTPAFLFPKDEERKKKWISAINRKNFVPGPSAAVCINHFDERFLFKEDKKLPQKDGSVTVVQRKKKVLTKDAFPTLFPNQPGYLSKTLLKKRKSPSERRKAALEKDGDIIDSLGDTKSVKKRRKADLEKDEDTVDSMDDTKSVTKSEIAVPEPEKDIINSIGDEDTIDSLDDTKSTPEPEEDINSIEDEDIIDSLDDIKSVIKNRLTGSWLHKIEENCVHIYKVEVFERPEVAVVLQILSDLSVKLYYRKCHLNSNILRFVLKNEHQLDRWTKFDSVLSFLSSFKITDTAFSHLRTLANLS